MTSHHKIACFLLLFLLSLPAWGQYTATYTSSAVDVLNSTYAPPNPHTNYNCVSKNCWVNLASGVAFTQITASPDSGEVQAIDGSGNRWRWLQASQSWSELHDGIPWKSMHIGSFANNQYLGISTSNIPYYWTGSAWARLGAVTQCDDGTISASGTAYCLNAGSVWWWTANGWQEISTADAVAISANRDGALLMQSTNNVFVWSAYGQNWTQITTLPFTPLQAADSVQMADDGSFSILDNVGEIQISHDGGNTWTAVNHSAFPNAFTAASVAHAAAQNSFALATTGQVWHLNSIVPAGTIALTGSCGSACGGGNPSVQMTFDTSEQAAGSVINVGLYCPGWTYENGDPPEACDLVTNANTVQNTSVTAFLPRCDGFAPGNDNKCSAEVVDLGVLLAGTLVFKSDNQCNCLFEIVDVNQKYYVSSNNYNTAPNGTGWFGLGGWWGGIYYWPSTTLEQFCTSIYFPILDAYTSVGGVNLVYHQGPQGGRPSKMPGRYVNGDVPAEVDIATHTEYEPLPLPLIPILRVYNNNVYTAFSGHIYTWNNTDTRLRGPGGYPTTPCQGQKLN